MRLRVMALSASVLLVTACHVWRPAVVGPRQLVEEERPTFIRIVRADGTRTEVRLPRVVSDSLIAEIWGRRRVPRTAGSSVPHRNVAYHDTLSFALADVVRVETRELSTGRTLGVVVLAPVVTYGVLIVVCLMTNCMDR